MANSLVCFRLALYGSKSMLYMLVHLAISLVFELGLNKVPIHESTPSLLTIGCVMPTATPPSPTRSMAERRAVLACFFITSQYVIAQHHDGERLPLTKTHSISYHIAKNDALRWTTHLNECLEVLFVQPEWTGDRTLAQLVRMQLVLERMVLTGWYHDTMNTAGPKLPSSAYLHTLHAELATVRASFTAEEEATGASCWVHTTEWQSRLILPQMS